MLTCLCCIVSQVEKEGRNLAVNSQDMIPQEQQAAEEEPARNAKESDNVRVCCCFCVCFIVPFLSSSYDSVIPR